MSKMTRFPHKMVISVCLIMCMCASMMTGCGSVPVMEEEVVELHEPQTGDAAVMNTEKVARRNLYHTLVYDAVVYPYVEIYSYEAGQKFGSYGAVLGETVGRGAPLVHMEAQAVSKKIESMKERILSLTETYEKFRVKAEEELAGLRKELEDLKNILEDMEEEEPEQYIAGAGGQSTVNPAYASWQKEWKKCEGQYNDKDLSVSKKAEALRQKTELYELDYQYYSGQLQKLEDEKRAGTITSQISGKVVALGMYSPGDSIRANVPVAAVGDMERKYVKCAKISEINRLRALEIYAVAGGKRYEVSYTEGNDDKHSLFKLTDEEGDTEIGDAAALVLVLDIREQVLTVSADSIYKDGLQQYVYVLEDGNVVTRVVQTGMSDGVYTEILSGVEEGEQVMTSRELTVGANTAVLEKGVLKNAYAGSGTLIYPVRTMVNNSVENGTVYFQEYQVTEDQHVEKGDVIATIRVESDGVVLEGKETELKRAKERLADLIAQDEEKNKEAIEQRRESIADLEEEIALLRTDYGTTAIRATVSGRVLALGEYVVGDVVKYNSPMAVVADENITFLSLGNEGGYLSYGDVLRITYKDTEGKDRTAEGTVVTFGVAMDGVLGSKDMLAALPEGRLEDVQTDELSFNGYAVNRIDANGSLVVMENVVIVPKAAVTVSEGCTYVNVLMEDGTVMPVSFLAGGMNRDSYWVIDGLTEGMKICWG